MGSICLISPQIYQAKVLIFVYIFKFFAENQRGLIFVGTHFWGSCGRQGPSASGFNTKSCLLLVRERCAI